MKNGTETYWQRVAAGLCIECGLFAPKHVGGKRCDDCLKRVAEYNKNRRGKPEGATRATYRMMQKEGSKILGLIADITESKNE